MSLVILLEEVVGLVVYEELFFVSECGSEVEGVIQFCCVVFDCFFDQGFLILCDEEWCQMNVVLIVKVYFVCGVGGLVIFLVEFYEDCDYMVFVDGCFEIGLLVVFEGVDICFLLEVFVDGLLFGDLVFDEDYFFVVMNMVFFEDGFYVCVLEKVCMVWLFQVYFELIGEVEGGFVVSFLCNLIVVELGGEG